MLLRKSLMLNSALHHVTASGAGLMGGCMLLDSAPAVQTVAHGVPVGLIGLATVALQLLNTFLINRQKNKNVLSQKTQ